MNVTVVIESYFGNTSAVADAVAEGLRSTGAVVNIVNADPPPDVGGADLVVIGAPTHNMGLPQASSRRQAADSGGTSARAGVAEWLDGMTPSPSVTYAAFDTVTGSGFFSGSAAKQVRKRLRKKGTTLAASESFVVRGREGPMRDGEITRAADWGRSLA